MRSTLWLLWLLAGIVVGGCKDFPGADGRYADFDQGRSNNRAVLPADGATRQM